MIQSAVLGNTSDLEVEWGPGKLLPPSGHTVRNNPDLLPPSHRRPRKKTKKKPWYELFVENPNQPFGPNFNPSCNEEADHCRARGMYVRGNVSGTCTCVDRDALIAPSFHGLGQGYYPPVRGYPGYAPRGPGGLPTNQASLDVKAFVPAQYEHVRLTPLTGILVIAGMVGVISLISRHKVVAK